MVIRGSIFKGGRVIFSFPCVCMVCLLISACNSPLPSAASYYSERLMGTARVVPGGNYRGYEESSLLLQAASLKNRSLLLVHGTADTDVHFDHTLKLSRALTKAGVTFRYNILTSKYRTARDSL